MASARREDYTNSTMSPLDLLTVNLGIYDQHQALEIVELVDQVGFDSISLGVTLGYIMEYNAQHPDKPIFDGMTFGDLRKPATSFAGLPLGGHRRLAVVSGASLHPSERRLTPWNAKASSSQPTCLKPIRAIRSPLPAGTCRCEPSCC